MNLKAEKGQFKNETTGEIINYVKYYVEWNGIKLYLKPSDATSKQILETIIK